MNETYQKQLTYSQFVEALRGALTHLYDPVALRKNPLMQVLLPHATISSIELRRTLTASIESLKPTSEMPAGVPQHRGYQVLMFRYVQQLSQQEVADQLGFSRRHLTRAQNHAVNLLAGRLATQHALVFAPEPEGQSPRPIVEATTLVGLPEDLNWLAEAGFEDRASLRRVLDATLCIVQPLAAQHGVNLQIEDDLDLPLLEIRPDALRQILVLAMSRTIRSTNGKYMSLRTYLEKSTVVIDVQTAFSSGGSADRASHTQEDESLSVLRYLVEQHGGSFQLQHDPSWLSLQLRLKAAERVSVLVVDDNENTITLLQRYVTETRFQVIPISRPEEALELAVTASPDIVVLDLMMPGLDGWELLGRLKHHPQSSHIPVIVCSILAEEELSLSLGASGYLRKPINRSSFLQALETIYQTQYGLAL